ncbi:MAG: hypothetical protein HN633_15720 [Candidatus Marinimicrobia bacterium]|nr:hypothetical protein [Candidatus Neomarinimicrobiota bacterium]
MNRIILIELLLLITSISTSIAQTSVGTSTVKSLNLRKAPNYPPDLVVEVSFVDYSDNQILDAEETAFVNINIKNLGRGKASELYVDITPDRISGLTFNSGQIIGNIGPGKSKDVKIFITAEHLVKSQQVELLFDFSESNDFPPDQHSLSFEVREFISPELTLVSGLDIDDASNNGMVEAGELVGIPGAVQNIGQGFAKDVKVKIDLGDNVYFGGESSTEFELETIDPGLVKEFTFEVYTNKKAIDIPIYVTISESYGIYGKANIRLPIEFKRRVKSITETKIVGLETQNMAINIAEGYDIDIESNIPSTRKTNKYAIAVIIGNRNYLNPDVPTVDFAIRDATLMKEYLMTAFGYQEGNIIYLEDATQGTFNATFGTESRSGKLHNYIKKNKSDVFVYYSGHGAPDPETKDGYFVPVDCDPSLVALNGYSLDLFYSQIRKLKARSVTVVIDACFSGSSDNGMLLKNISPVFIEVNQKALTGNNSIIFTSASGEQVSSWYPDKKHSLFTYYYLKGIQGEANTNGDILLTVGELHNYLEENVSYMARRLNNREQTPQITGDQTKVLYRY